MQLKNADLIVQVEEDDWGHDQAHNLSNQLQHQTICAYLLMLTAKRQNACILVRAAAVHLFIQTITLHVC